jgi:hypothetical protein
MASVLLGFVIVCILCGVLVIVAALLFAFGWWRRSRALKWAAVFPLGLSAILFVPMLLLVIAWMIFGESEKDARPPVTPAPNHDGP